MHKHRRDTSNLSAEIGEKGWTGGTRVSVTPEKLIPNKKKKIKSLALSQEEYICDGTNNDLWKLWRYTKTIVYSIN